MICDDGRRIIVYGCGWEAEKILYNLKKYGLLDRLDYFCDTYRTGSFYGYNIKCVNDIAYEELVAHLIVVSVRWGLYNEIKKQLEERGLVEFRHFFWGALLKKRIVTFNTNCYQRVINDFLMHSTSFRSNFVVYPTPQIQLNREGRISEGLLNVTDVFIYQDIRKDNKFSAYLASDFLVQFVPSECICVCIPNLVGFGKIQYPYLIETSYKVGDVFLFNYDEAIESVLKNNHVSSIDEFLKIGAAVGDVYKIKNEINRKIDQLKEREKNWDIKVSDYIIDNYKKIRLFNDYAHPGNIVMRKICEQLATILEVDDISYVSDDVFWIGMDMFAHKSINDKLGFTWKQETVKDRYSEDRINYSEYLEEYMWARC